jgi:hypothetical protein
MEFDYYPCFRKSEQTEESEENAKDRAGRHSGYREGDLNTVPLLFVRKEAALV